VNGTGQDRPIVQDVMVGDRRMLLATTLVTWWEPIESGYRFVSGPRDGRRANFVILAEVSQN